MLRRCLKQLGMAHFLMILTGILCLSLSGSDLTFSQPSTIQLYFFYAEDCQPCQVILQSYLPTLKSMFPSLGIKTFDVGNPAHYETLGKLEKKLNRRGQELPVVFIGDHLLSGEMEVMEKLNPLLLEYQAKGGASIPSVEITPVTQSSEKTFSVDLAYFYQQGCPKCNRANYLLKFLLKRYPRLHVQEIDINTPDGKRLNETLANRLQLPPEKRLIAPSIFIGNDFLSPEDVTESKTEALIQKYEKVEAKSALEVDKNEIKKGEESIVKRFKSLGVLAILSAGLIEGMNPCSIATLIFFISYLTMVGRKRKEIFWVGMGFAGTAFFTHLLLGIGILSFIQHFSFLPLFSRVVYTITFIFALFLGTFSLYDYVQLKKGRPSKIKLQVPVFIKKKIHKIIRTQAGELESNQESSFTRLLLAAVVIGFIVTLLQFTCTSQVYLPTILFATNIPSFRGSAILYLILYNSVYITPLLVIFGIVYWGVTSEQLSLFLQKRVATIKLFTSLFFFLLAGILIFVML